MYYIGIDFAKEEYELPSMYYLWLQYLLFYIIQS
jgi:hypothetical protein